LHLRGHLLAAIVWSLVTICQTVNLLVYSRTPNLAAHAVVFVAGWVMVSSWAQFAERKCGQSQRQNRRWLLYRLFVQTIWGPLALWLGVAALCHVGERNFDDALARRDLPTALLLREYGLGNVTAYKHGDGLEAAIQDSDLSAVGTYLAAGIKPEEYYGPRDSFMGAALNQENVAITRLLLEYSALPNNQTYSNSGYEYPLHIAVKNKNVRQVEALLQHGAERKVYNSEGKTPFQVAKEQKYLAVVDTLTCKYAAAIHTV
jgi:hypothetical protein